MNGQLSMYQSSVRSFKQFELPTSNQFIKYLHQNYPDQRKNYFQQPHPSVSPLLRKHQSYNTFTSKIMQRPNRDNSFRQSMLRTSSINPKQYLREDRLYEDRTSAKEGAHSFDKELLQKEIKRLKEQIKYWKQQKEKYENRSVQLLKMQTRVEILERQYNKIKVDYQQLLRDKELTNESILPLSLNYALESPIIGRPKGFNFSQTYRDLSQSKFSVQKSAITPIYKINDYRNNFQSIPEQSSQKNWQKAEIQALQQKYKDKIVFLQQRVQYMKKEQEQLIKKLAQVQKQNILKDDQLKKIKEQVKSYIQFKQKWTQLSQKHQQNQILIKMLQHELNQKKQNLSQLQVQSKQLQQANTSKSQKQQELLKDYKQLQVSFKQFKTNMLSKQQNSRKQLMDKVKQLNVIIQHERRGRLEQLRANQQLRRLNSEWRAIENKTRWMKQIDSAVDHLWQVKQVQYASINAILSNMKQS